MRDSPYLIMSFGYFFLTYVLVQYNSTYTKLLHYCKVVILTKHIYNQFFPERF